ncbi:MAG: type II toxin-antitoxin system RelE family toxin [Wolbachia sp.]
MEPKEYKIKFLESVDKKDLLRIPKKERETIKKAIAERLKTDLANRGEALRYELKGYRRLEAGGYRLIYRVNIAKYKVFIVAAGPRGDIYKLAGLADLLSRL